MQKQKLVISLILLSLVMLSIFAYSFASGNFGFEVYETHTKVWNIDLGTVYVGIPKSFNVTVECKEDKGEFLITYHLEISGPQSICNDYLRLRWWDTDGADFIIGKDGHQQFSGTGTLTWKGNSVDFEAGHKNNITLTLTFLTLDALGDYSAKMWVAFTEKPQVRITPKVLNIKSQGQWVTAHISLPEPYKEEDIDIGSVKLWYKDDFVQAEWGKATKHFLLVKFPRNEVTAILKSEVGRVQLAVTGLVNGIEFYGTDTIIVIEPRR